MLLRSSALLASLLTLGACVATPAIDAQAPVAAAEPRFDALRFFEGRLEGRGRLDTILAGPVGIRVESHGRIEDGTLHLTQVIHEGEKPARTRHWTIRETSPGRYSGTLSDAQGAVTGEVHSNRLHLAFTMEGNLPTEQWLTLSPDGRRAYNVLTVRKFGLPVARLAEDIRKLD